jgi:hypothetical protein
MPSPAVISAALPVYRGDAWSKTLRFWADEVGGTPIDLTAFGTSFTAQVRYSATTASFTPFTVDDTDAATGVLVLSLTGDQTGALMNSTYHFDVQATGGALSPRTIITGTLSVTKDVTQP